MITQQMYHPVKNVLGVNLSAVDHMDLNKPWPFFHSIIWGKESEVPLFFFFLLWTETTQQHSCQSNNLLLSRWKCISGKKKKNYNRLKHTKC